MTEKSETPFKDIAKAVFSILFILGTLGFGIALILKGMMIISGV